MFKLTSKFLAPLFSAVILILLVGCNLANSKMHRISFEGDFTLDIPVYMEEMNIEYENIVAQYGSEYHEHHVTITRESNQIYVPGFSELFVETYALLCEKNYELGLKDAVSEKMDDAVVNRNDMETVSYRTTGIFNNEFGIDVPVVYYNMYYKGPDNFYIVSTWTIADREIKYQKNMRHIVESLKKL
ncbi:MAG: hypothetical protein ACPG21_07290 [Crocinitomicaceae bacterium]